MTTNLALAAPLTARPEREPRRTRPELVEVTPTRAQRRARPRVFAAIVAVGSLGVLLLAQLGISMVLSQGAYELNSLQSQQTELSRTQQQLDEKLNVLRSPQNLATNAQALGMIANTTPVYLDPKTGQVFGTPTPAAASDSTSNTANQVQNQLLDGVAPVAKQGDTAASAEQPKSTTATSKTADATQNTGKSGSSSASDGGSATSSVPSDANQLQAPTTR